jgi:hypothetical protein
MELRSAKLGSTKLYRTVRRAVILAGLALALAPTLPAQSSAAKKAPKGPRALGLVELAPNGKAHLVPITILYYGEFYDATAYKASPVPMALESGTVYEGERAGVSQGLFTVSSALQGNNTWIGNGTWQSDSAIAAAKAAAAKRRAAMSKPAPEPVEGPPVLRRASPKEAKPSQDSPAPAPAGNGPASSPAAATPSASAPASTPPAEEEDSDRPVLKRPAPAAVPVASTPSPSVSATEEEDPDRPVLKRGAPTPAELKKQSSSAPMPAAKDAHKTSAPAHAAPGPVQFMAAISDAAGPQPRPYTYSLKPDEEQQLRKKTLALAADAVRAWAAQPESVGAQPPARTSRPARKSKPPQPSFEDVRLHAFDLSDSNEPVVVLTAKARLPLRPGTTSNLEYIITLVAREDIYGDLHKVLASVTDTQHFDVLSRLELIDAVDADGDGRGELLFRQVSDSGSAFVLYRIIGDQAWPLFQGTPGQ